MTTPGRESVLLAGIRSMEWCCVNSLDSRMCPRSVEVSVLLNLTMDSQ